MEEETGKARRDVATLAKELHTTNTQASAIEAKIETKKNERHNLLLQSKMDDIILPMVKGSMDDIGTGESDSQNDTTSIPNSSGKENK